MEGVSDGDYGDLEGVRRREGIEKGVWVREKGTAYEEEPFREEACMGWNVGSHGFEEGGHCCGVEARMLDFSRW